MGANETLKPLNTNELYGAPGKEKKVEPDTTRL
jgi:hypothetical protein